MVGTEEGNDEDEEDEEEAEEDGSVLGVVVVFEIGCCDTVAVVADFEELTCLCLRDRCGIAYDGEVDDDEVVVEVYESDDDDDSENDDSDEVHL